MDPDSDKFDEDQNIDENLNLAEEEVDKEEPIGSKVIVRIYDLNSPYFEITQLVPGTEILTVVEGAVCDQGIEISIIDATDNVVDVFTNNTGRFKIKLKEESFPGEMTLKVRGKELIRDELHDFEINKLIYISDTITEIIPEIRLYREENMYGIASQFLPNDLIHLKITHTGTSKNTKIQMIDTHGQIRYHGIGGGSEHLFTTRVQKTKVLGEWSYKISGTLPENEEEFEIYYPFNLVSEITEVVETEPILVEDLDAKCDFPEVIATFDIFGSTSVIKGIGPAAEKLLAGNAVSSAIQVALADPQDLSELITKGIKSVTTWVQNAQLAIFGNVVDIKPDRYEEFFECLSRKEEMVEEVVEELGSEFEFPEIIEKHYAASPPSKIHGIGKVSEEKLFAVNIKTALAVAQSDPKLLSEKINVNFGKVARWIEHGQIEIYGNIVDRSLIGGSTSSIKEKPKQAKVLNNADTPREKLRIIADFNINGAPSLIKGIGPAAERDLAKAKITKVIQLPFMDEEAIAAFIGCTPKKVNRWKEYAQIALYGIKLY